MKGVRFRTIKSHGLTLNFNRYQVTSHSINQKTFEWSKPYECIHLRTWAEASRAFNQAAQEPCVRKLDFIVD